MKKVLVIAILGSAMLILFLALSGAAVAAASGENAVEDEEKVLAQVGITVGTEIFVVDLYDTPLSKELLDTLPLTLMFSDYAGTEKIAYLPERLQIPDTQEVYEAVKGDLTIYISWGNLAFFYKEYDHHSSLYKMGHMKDIDAFAGLTGDFSAVLDVYDDEDK